MAFRAPVTFRKWLNMGSGPDRTTTLPPQVLQVADEMQPWIESYVSRFLHGEASPWDLRDRLLRRLERKVTSECLAYEIKDLIAKTVKDLVHDQNRTEFRRSRKFRSQASVDQLIDPQSHLVEEKLIQESEALAVLRIMSQDDRHLIEQLYGLRNLQKVSRAEMAQKLGVRRNTLDQRLRRIFDSVRKVVGS